MIVLISKERDDSLCPPEGIKEVHKSDISTHLTWLMTKSSFTKLLINLFPLSVFVSSRSSVSDIQRFYMFIRNKSMWHLNFELINDIINTLREGSFLSLCSSSCCFRLTQSFGNVIHKRVVMEMRIRWEIWWGDCKRDFNEYQPWCYQWKNGSIFIKMQT